MMDEADVLNDLDQLQSRYDVLRRLGQDGAFAVYGVRNRESDRHFAVKVMGDPGTRDAKLGALHVWRAHTVWEPLDHPHLMVLHAVHHLQGGTVALAMERRRGRTLAERIENDGPLTIEEVERILREIAGALAYLHGRGAVHRGVRPQSIFLDKDSGHARLAHFGIEGGDGDGDATADAAALYHTFAYLAPEQIDGRTQVDGRRLGVRSDLYSLGLVGYAMLTGGELWEAANLDGVLEARKREPLPPLATLRGDAPAYLCQAIEGCLANEPRRRWRSVDEFVARLDPDAEGARPIAAMDWAGLRARLVSGFAGVRASLREKVSVARRLGPAVALREKPRAMLRAGLVGSLPTAAIALIALTLLRGRDESGALEPADSLPPMTAASEIPLAEFDGLGATHSTASTRPGVQAGDQASIQEDFSATPTPTARRPATGPAPTGQSRDARASGPTGGLVLLGDPVDPQTASPLLGERLRGGAPGP